MIMAHCKRCGYPIKPHYTYCKKCYYELGEPTDTVRKNYRTHKCRSCGTPVQGRYYYCSDCAKRLGFLKEGVNCQRDY